MGVFLGWMNVIKCYFFLGWMRLLDKTINLNCLVPGLLRETQNLLKKRKNSTRGLNYFCLISSRLQRISRKVLFYKRKGKSNFYVCNDWFLSVFDKIKEFFFCINIWLNLHIIEAVGLVVNNVNIRLGYWLLLPLQLYVIFT